MTTSTISEANSHEAGGPLDAIFSPRSIAVIGATEAAGSVGRTLFSNLKDHGYTGNVYPINPKHDTILGVKAYPTIGAVPEQVDLAVIATPAPTVPALIAQCVEAKVRGAIIISAGFKELGPAGVELERQVLDAARGKMRIIGPNCLGVMNPLNGLNATFANAIARPGNVAFISQSGALCTAILDWSLQEYVGFSAFVSIGSMLDIGWGDLIDYLANDPRTSSILIYMESVGDARRFLSAAREAALSKPIIVIKAGRTDAASKAAASHTGSLTGSDEVFDAALLRAGVLRVANIADLFYMAEVLARQPRPRGPRLSIVTNAGGPGVLATDAIIGAGGELASLAPETIQRLNEILPPHWSRNNPIDILGDASPDRYAQSLKIAADDPNSDGLLVILTPQDMTDPTQTAECLKAYSKLDGKPVLASWMGGASVAAGQDILNRAGIPTFPYPDTAARAFYYMWRYAENLRALYETPAAAPANDLSSPAMVDAILRDATSHNRTLLDEVESKRVLEAYGIPTVRTEAAHSADEAVAAAEKIGFPVAVKLWSRFITHKTDVGGVHLNIASPDEVRAAFDAIRKSVAEKAGAEHFQGVTVQTMLSTRGAYEVIIGSTVDPQFGPVLLFGAGGQLVEVFKDRSLGLPPLNATLARRLMERTRIMSALRGVRGAKAVDLPALEQLLVRFSQLVVSHPIIREIDINPLLVWPDRMAAVDARVVLFPSDTPAAKLPRPAIRPYPSQYVRPFVMHDGQIVMIRPIRPEDEPMVARFHGTVSDESIQMRYFHAIKLSRRVAHERLIRICFNDYDRELALVAEHASPDGTSEILGIGRLTRHPGSGDAEFGILISDRWQHRGLGYELLSRILEVARAEKVRRVYADILSQNVDMQNLSRKLGFAITDAGDGTVKAEIILA